MNVSFRPEYRYLPAEAESQFHVITTFKSEDAEEPAKRTAISLALVIDRSGSMSGPAITRTLEAVSEVVDLLTRKDRITIVTFSDTVEVIQELTPATNKPDIHQKVRTIFPGGGTNLSGGWLKALQTLAEKEKTNDISRVILLTDGGANQGVTDVDQLRNIAATFQAKGISTSTFGLGHGFNEHLLKSIAEKGGGNFSFIQGPEDVADAFRFEFGELSTVIGQNLEAEFSCSKGVEILETFGAGNQPTAGKTFTLALGDISENLEKTVTLRVRVPRKLATGTQPLLRVRAQYQNTSGDFGVARAEGGFSAEFRPGDARRYLNHEVLDDVMLERTQKVKTQIAQDVQARHVGKALTMLNERLQILGERLLSPDVAKTEELQTEVAALKSLKTAIEQRAPGQGKMIQTQIEDFQKKKGIYLKARSERKFILNTTLPAGSISPFKELITHLEEKLTDLGQEKDFRQRCVICLHELVANALEHGCRTVSAGEVIVRGVFRKGAAMITVSDPGPGFDHERRLQAAQELIASQKPEATQPAPKPSLDTRGRGISLVLSQVDELTYTCGGSEVMVTLADKIPEGVISFDNVSVQAAGQSKPFSVTVKNHVMQHMPMVEIELNDGIDLFNEHLTRQAFMQVLAQGANCVILNVGKVSFVDSAGMGFFVSALKSCQEKGGDLFLINIDPSLRKVFKALRLNTMLRMFDSLDDLRADLEADAQKKPA